MANKKFVSKVDEKLKAAEARRAELERVKVEEQQRKLEMRRNRLLNNTPSINSNNQSNQNNTPKVDKINVRDYGYLRVQNCSELIKLKWNKKCTRFNKDKRRKLFTINGVQELINCGEFDLAQVILGIMSKSLPARHPIQNKFAQLHGRIVEIKEKNKRTFAHESALNFTGSISPVRLPDFEADLNKLSNLSSPIGMMEEIGRKYENIDELRITQEAIKIQIEKSSVALELNPYDHDLIPDDFMNEVSTEQSKQHEHQVSQVHLHIANDNENDQQNNFPSVISPMKRPQKDIEAEVVYTPQRKSARRLADDEVMYDDEQVSQILLNDPNAAFIANPYITTPLKKTRKPEE